MAMTVGVACCLVACAGPGPAPEAPREGPPPTEWDPAPWSPPASDTPRTGDTVGARATGGVDQPRWVLLRFLQAVRDADTVTLERLLTDPVLSSRLRERPRSFWVERLTHGRRQAALDSEMPIHQLVSIRRVEVVSADQLGSRPPGVQDSDLLLSFPLEPAGRRLLGPLLLWRDHGQMLVRPGPEPRVLGL
jgi:hypothetical protein